MLSKFQTATLSIPFNWSPVKVYAPVFAGKSKKRRYNLNLFNNITWGTTLVIASVHTYMLVKLVSWFFTA